jgi:hypothetical protein
MFLNLLSVKLSYSCDYNNKIASWQNNLAPAFKALDWIFVIAKELLMDSQLSMQKWCRDNRPKDNSLHKLKGMHGVKSDT